MHEAIQLEDVHEILALEVVVALVVEIAQVAAGGVDLVHGDGGFHMGPAVGRPGRVRQVAGVELHQHGPPGADLLLQVRHEGPPGGEFLDVEPVEFEEIPMGELEEGPLVPFEVDGQGEGEGRQGFLPQAVEELDDHVRVAVGLCPDAVPAMDAMALVGGWIEREDLSHVESSGHGAALLAQASPRVLRTGSGQASSLNPCVLKSARAMRSSPKPMQAEWAGRPSAVRMSKAWPK